MAKITFLIFISLLGTSLGAGGTQSPNPDEEADTSATESVVQMFIGYPLKLTCNMTNNDNVALHLDWFKDNVKLEESDRLKIFQMNSSLVISKPEKNDVGIYQCDVANDSISQKPHPKTFQVIYMEWKRMAKSLSITDQETLELDCGVEGQPSPNITWKKDNELIEKVINGSRLSFSDSEGGVLKSKMIISKVELSDRGNYTCHITTLLSTHIRYTFVRVKDIYAALWPFLGIVVEVLLLGIIIFIFEKRRAKEEFEESDTDQGNDQKNTADHNKDSVRHRK